MPPITAIPAGLLLASLAAVTAGCTTTPELAIPDILKPATGETLAMVVPARGVQVYQCRAGKQAGHEWAFVAPDATLYDERGNAIGRHGAGPFWEASDGSRITGSLRARADAPNAGDIPWLLLAARAEGPSGRFSQVTSIQRVNTAGGLAPADGCTRDTLGREARVHYTADYRFHAIR